MPQGFDLQAILRSKDFRQLDRVEMAIALVWLEAHGAEFDSIEFNFRVGNPPARPAWADAGTEAMLAYAARRRADACLVKGGLVTLVEIKAFVRCSTIRQLNDYRDLYALMRPADPRPRGLLLGIEVQPGIPAILEEQGIALDLYPHAWRSLGITP